MTWNPLAKPATTTVELECSRDEAGVAQARATFRRWGAEERLAYEDAMTTEILAKDKGGEDTVRLGVMRLLNVALTIRTVEGFPDRVVVERPHHDPDLRARGVVEETTETFDPRKPAHLRRLDADTFAELLEHAQKVQRLPGAPDEDAAEGDAPADPTAAPATATGTTTLLPPAALLPID